MCEGRSNGLNGVHVSALAAPTSVHPVAFATSPAPPPHCSCCNHSCVPNAEAFKRDEDEDGSGAFRGSSACLRASDAHM